MKVSYIVPVYKVEQYLSQCIESLLGQTYTDFEILLVDDGSPDGCPALCDQWAKNDSRIRSLHKKNGGLSDARNYGLQNAKGDYVVFIDGDDFWVRNDSLQKLVEIASEHQELDFIGFNCNYYYPDSNRMAAWVPYEKELENPTDKNKVTVALVKSGTFPMSACLKVLKRNFLIDNELFFKKGQIAEDIPWFINVLDVTSKCCFVNEYIYGYRQNVTGSITKTGGRKSFDSLFDIFKTELAKICQRSFNEKAKNAIMSFLAYEYCILLTYKGIDKGTRKELFQYKNVLNHNMNPKVKRVSRWYKLFGVKAIAMILSLYQWIRMNRK